MLAALGLAAAGALAGSMKDESSQTSGINLAPESANEAMARKAIGSNFSDMQNFVGAGPGQVDVGAGVASQRSLAAMLEQYSKGGFLPSESDFKTANNFAQQAYQPQQVALQQGFQQEQQRAAQLAAQMGRPVNDPIIQSKLSQEYMQSNERLNASQGAYASQYAQSLPQQRLGYTQQLTDVRSGLASQAMSNRQALLSLGSQIQGQERDWRLQTGQRYGDTSSGGGLKGAISGALGGLGAGMGVQGMMGQQGLQAAQTGYYNSMSQALPAFSGQVPTFANSGYQAPPMAPPVQQSFSAPQVPYYLQPSSPQNSMPFASPQFNMFGQMTPGGY